MTSVRIVLVTAIFIAFVSWSVPPIAASNLMGDVFKSASGKVLINLFGNYGVSADLIFPALHAAEALDVVRGALVRERRIRNLPVLAQDDPGSYWAPKRPPRSIRIEATCAVTYGQDDPVPLGACYHIEPQGASYEDMLAMMVALPELSAGTSRIEVTDPKAFRAARSAKLEPFRNLSLHFDPIWSPDGTQVLHTVWEPRGVRIEIIQAASREIIRLEPLHADIFTRPVWSRDGRFIAYASLRDEVRVFNTRDRSTRTFRPQSPPSERHIVILFEGTVLNFAFFNGTTGYEAYAYDAMRQGLRRITWHGRPPAWIDKAGKHGWALNRHMSLRPVRSPNGKYTAVFTFVRGQRRIQVNPLP